MLEKITLHFTPAQDLVINHLIARNATHSDAEIRAALLQSEVEHQKYALAPKRRPRAKALKRKKLLDK